MPDISQLPKGALPDIPDPRDLQLNFAFGAPLINWTVPVRLEEPADENQGSSDSCVAHSSSYLHWHHRKANWSRRSLFVRIAQDFGAYLRDGVREIVERGQHTKDEVSDPVKQTPNNMRNASGIDWSQALDGMEAKYFLSGDSIDGIAWCVRDFGGCVFGVYGNNAGWSDLTNPKPPAPGQPADWAHALYAMGYHLHNGKKCIIAKSSWCGAVPGHHEHHINQDHFDQGRIFNAWVLVPKENLPVYDRYVVLHQRTGRLGVCVVGEIGFGDVIVWAKNQAMLEELKQQFEIPASAPTITLP